MWNVRRHVPATLWVDRHPTEFAVDVLCSAEPQRCAGALALCHRHVRQPLLTALPHHHGHHPHVGPRGAPFSDLAGNPFATLVLAGLIARHARQIYLACRGDTSPST